jgi:hypothetical protein
MMAQKVVRIVEVEVQCAILGHGLQALDERLSSISLGIAATSEAREGWLSMVVSWTMLFPEMLTIDLLIDLIDLILSILFDFDSIYRKIDR